MQLPKWIDIGLRFHFITCFNYITLDHVSTYFKGQTKAEHRTSE